MKRQTANMFNAGRGRKRARPSGEFHGRSFRQR